MRHSLIPVAVVLAASCTVPAAQAGPTFSLGNAAGYNEFILGNSTRTNVDTLGKVAVGGNATFNNFTVNSAPNPGTTPSTNVAVIGGTLGGSQLNVQGAGSVQYGALQGGTAVYFNNGGTASQATSGNFFTSAATTLQNSAALLSQQAANGTATSYYGGLTLSATLPSGSTMNTVYFNLTAAQITSATSLNINITDNNGTTPVVIVNVDGTDVTYSNSVGAATTLNGVTQNDLLFNYYNATSLVLNQDAVEGSILAPSAAIVANDYGQVNGEVIGASLIGNIETHSMDQNTGQNYLFNGNPMTYGNPGVVPEPATIVTTLSGLAMAGGFAWKRRRRRPRAA